MAKKYIMNITGTEKFPLPQILPSLEDGKVTMLKAGEKVETKYNGESIGSEKRLVLITEDKTTKEDKKVK